MNCCGINDPFPIILRLDLKLKYSNRVYNTHIDKSPQIAICGLSLLSHRLEFALESNRAYAVAVGSREVSSLSPASSNFTEMRFETPGSCIVTP